jgi:hypothetical protein
MTARRIKSDFFINWQNPNLKTHHRKVRIPQVMEVFRQTDWKLSQVPDDRRGGIMNRFRLSLIAGLILIPTAHIVSAQPAPAKPKAPLNSSADREKADREKAEAARKDSERRAEARMLLTSLANEAYSFRDQTLRARSMGRIADALWDAQAEQARALFRKAWEAAEAVDRESREPPVLGQQPPNLRGEILTLAARRESALADEFLQKMKAEREETKEDRSGTNLWSLSEASEKRLSLAENLLSTGEIESALRFADPVLGRATISTLDFLTLLREKDAAAADQRYAAILANAGNNALADANTVSLLSSYLFTPHLYVLFNSSGGADTSSMSSTFPPPNVDPQLRLAFFQMAVAVLLRPQLPPEQPPQQQQGGAGIVSKYMVFKRLSPLFERYAPKELTTTMSAQLEALGSLVSAGVRQNENEWVQKGISPEKPRLANQESSLLDQIEHAAKIEESEFRKRVQAWVDASLAIKSIQNKRTERALELARSGDLTHIQRVWLLSQTAKLLAKTDRLKALSLLDDATAEVRRIEGADLDKPRGLLAIADAFRLIEPQRAWETAFDAVKAANSTEGFTGEDGALILRINSESLISTRTDGVPEFDIERIFGELAKIDYDRAVLLARGFQGEAPRAGAIIAVAQEVLKKRKSAPVSRPVPAAKN